MKIGNAKYGGESNKNFFKLKDGRSTFRILPPLGDLADDGRWSVFMSIHYGYKNSDGKMRTFQSPEIKDRKTKMVTSPDAAKERIAKLKVELEKAKAAGNKELEEKLFKLVGGQKPQFNLDSHHYLNVMDLQGNIGVLKIRHKCKLALDAVIKQLRAANKNPVSIEDGRFFNFDRSGNATDTVYQVSVYKETVEVQGMGPMERDYVHALTPEIIGRLAREASELNKLAAKPTSEEVQRIVSEGAKAVDEILDGKYGKNGTAAAIPADQEPDGEDEAVNPNSNLAGATGGNLATQQPVGGQTQPAVAASPVQQAVAQAPVTQAAAQPAVAAQPAAQAAPAAPAVTVTSQQTTAQVVNNQSDEDFLKGLGL